MAKSKRLEMIERTFGNETAEFLALTEFFDTCEGKSQSAMDPRSRPDNCCSCCVSWAS